MNFFEPIDNEYIGKCSRMYIREIMSQKIHYLAAGLSTRAIKRTLGRQRSAAQDPSGLRPAASGSRTVTSNSRTSTLSFPGHQYPSPGQQHPASAGISIQHPGQQHPAPASRIHPPGQQKPRKAGSAQYIDSVNNKSSHRGRNPSGQHPGITTTAGSIRWLPGGPPANPTAISAGRRPAICSSVRSPGRHPPYR